MVCLATSTKNSRAGRWEKNVEQCRSNTKPYYKQKTLYQCASKTTMDRSVIYEPPLCGQENCCQSVFVSLWDSHGFMVHSRNKRY